MSFNNILKEKKKRKKTEKCRGGRKTEIGENNLNFKENLKRT